MVPFYRVCTQHIAFWIINYTKTSKELFLGVKLPLFHLQPWSHLKAASISIYVGTSVRAAQKTPVHPKLEGSVSATDAGPEDGSFYAQKVVAVTERESGPLILSLKQSRQRVVSLPSRCTSTGHLLCQSSLPSPVAIVPERLHSSYPPGPRRARRAITCTLHLGNRVRRG